MYVITPKGMPDYYYCGPRTGFSSYKNFALKYVSLKVAKRAVRIVEDNERRNTPNCLPMVARKVED